MSSKENKKFFLEITVLIAFAALIVLVLIIQIHSQKNRALAINAAETHVASIQTLAPAYQWRGDITKVNDTSLAVKVQITDPSTNKQTNYDFKVNLTDATRIVEVDVPSGGANTNDFSSRTTEIQKKDLRSGQTVIFQSAKNAGPDLSVDADMVYLINITNS